MSSQFITIMMIFCTETFFDNKKHLTTQMYSPKMPPSNLLGAFYFVHQSATHKRELQLRKKANKNGDT